MSSLAEPCLIPSISYAELLHDDVDTRDLAAGNFAQALKSYGACRSVLSHTFVFLLDCSLYLEFQYGVYELAPGNWSVPGRALVKASKSLHEECNRLHRTLLNSLSSSMSLPQSLTSLHSNRNSFFAPYFYYFTNDTDKNTLRVPPHIDPTTLLFNFQDAHGGLKVADLSNQTNSCNLSSKAVSETARFITVNCQRGEFLVLAGNLLRKLVGEVKHSVHLVERPLGTSGFHLNYWTIPDLDTACGFGGKRENVEAYLARVFPEALGNS
ncbi:hypothetical protein BDW59DRAFT_182327 [Aspergillus cavernicola]|uniref:Clavaminate synthase-like protein n=1 Tax=Aspergillus cavernicola TaxID=176166 RepID=A0ABR4HNW5_9EURO